MYTIETLNSIAPKGLERLPSSLFQIEDESSCTPPDGILLRSYNMHDMKFSDNLLGISRAGAGVNNIPIERCSEQGIVVFNTPGANANAVKELVMGGFVLASRNLAAGLAWTYGLAAEGDKIPELVEKRKSK